MNKIAAITLDLDDTLWPVWPVIHRAEDRLWAFIADSYPSVAASESRESLAEIKTELLAQHPEWAHDLTRMRHECLRTAFARSGGDEAGADAAMALFLRARNDVEFFDDAREGLEAIASEFPLLAVSNGNANIEAIGIDHLFKGAMSSIDAGVAKPHRDIFLKSCAVLGVEPHNTLHVGDHLVQDIAGAADAGLQTAWINRTEAVMDGPSDPGIVATDMLDLARQLKVLK